MSLDLSPLTIFIFLINIFLFQVFITKRNQQSQTKHRLAQIEEEVTRLKRLNEGRLAVLEGLPAPLLMLDGQLEIVRLNKAARAIFGDRGEGTPATVFIKGATLLEALGQVLKQRQPVTIEYTHLERRFIATVQPLETHQALRSRVVVLMQDVTTERLAREANTNFVANASHELRTPLTALLGFIETLQGPARDDHAAQAHFLALMHEQASRMARLVADLLSLSRIERRRDQPPTDRVDIIAILKGLMEILRQKSQQHNMSFQLEAPETVLITGDQDELTQLFQNLMDNALNYGEPGTPVLVSVIKGETVTVSVTNTGDGITAEDIPRLTERFYRTRNAQAKSDTGTGLGLAIVKNIVERHCATLKITSVRSGETTFAVCFKSDSCIPLTLQELGVTSKPTRAERPKRP